MKHEHIRRQKNNIRKRIAGFVISSLLSGTIALTAHAAPGVQIDSETYKAAAVTQTEYSITPVYLDGHETGYYAYVIQNGVTYMPLRIIAELLIPDAHVYWDSKTQTANVKTDALSLSAKPGECYITANERYLALSGLYPAENELLDGTTYVPLRTAVRAMGGSIAWNDAKKRVEITSGSGTILSGDEYYDKDDVDWLSRILYAEAGDQSLRGQLAVGTVIMNRVKDDSFPDTLYDVIFDNKYAVQFTPTVNGAIYQTPSKESILAAKLILDGCSLSPDALYFLDPSIASSFWIVENRTALFTIGCHDFYS